MLQLGHFRLPDKHTMQLLGKKYISFLDEKMTWLRRRWGKLLVVNQFPW